MRSFILSLLFVSLFQVDSHSFSLMRRKTSPSLHDSIHMAHRILPDNSTSISTSTSSPDILQEGLLPSHNNDSIQRYIDLTRTMIGKVRELNNYIKNIDEASRFALPVGISKTIGNVTYEMAIHAIRLKPAYAELDIVMQIETPQGQTLSFMANGIKFSSKGGIVGDTKLQLLGDYAINLNGNKSQIILKGTASRGNTYASIDCDGFKQLGIDADIKFSRDLLRPENADGSLGDGNVVSSFSTILSSWNDLVVQVSLPAFQVTGLKGVGFHVQDAVFDFSDVRNAPSITFPEGYQSSQILPENPNLWRGFYLRNITIKLPPELKQKGSTERTVIQASGLIIDNVGVTGTFQTTNLLTLQQGDMNGWAFSVDNIKISLLANELQEAGFGGKVVIPVSNEETPFEYQALIQPGGNYLFHVSPSKNMKFNVWKANVDIYESSYLDIRVANGRFLPKANLNGRMNVKGSLSEGGQGVELANITFENLEIQAVRPYIKVGYFSFGSEAAQQKMAGFPISINNIALKSISDTEAGLDFDLKLNLVGDEGGSFAADAGLTLVGTLDKEKGFQSWRYKDISVRQIGVDIDGGAFKIKGQLLFYKNDVAYGDGFNGNVKAEFTPGIKVSATAIFGNVAGSRYWYADAMASFPAGLPIFTGVGVYGFGGGAYYKMKMDNTGKGSALGKTSSGVVYVPDAKAGLGLKAIVNIASHPKPEAFNGDVTFEISFFQGGGVRYISFGGNGYLATPGLDVNLSTLQKQTNKLVAKVKSIESQMSGASLGLLSSGGNENTLKDIFGEIGANAGKQGQISARVLISYDFENKVLHGNFEAYVNVAGGLIKGNGANGKAGWAVLHFAPQEWYVYVGTPEDRIGISLGIGPLRAGADSYFMVGTKIPGSPPPPSNVSRILGGGDYNYMKDLNAIGSGAGFAFGSSMFISTGDLQFLMFYARLDAGAGFDIMLKNYGDARCAGSNERIGINGWYANGQAYAYFDGSIGIKVKVFGSKKKIKILDIGAAALLQAKLPNPIWMRGVVGGHFSVLGGLVSGQCRFQVTIGEECEIVKPQGEDRAVGDIQVIAQLTPETGETAVSVFNTPQVVFNMPVGKTFELSEDEVKKSFRIKLDEFKVIDANKQPVQGMLEWNNTNDVVAFNAYEVLPPSQDVRVIAQISFEEIKGGSWVPVTENGKVITERNEVTFKTGTAPDYIPLTNVDYSYPVVGQANFYRDEYPEGYIKLKRGQAYLFAPGAEWKQIGRMTTTDGTVVPFNFNYTSGSNTVSFAIPGSLRTGQNITLELVNIPAQQNGSVDRNVRQETNKVGGDDAIDTEIATKKAEGAIADLQEKSIFSSYFRSSTYATLNAKLDGLSRSRGSAWQIYNGIDELSFSYTGAELFDAFETGGTDVAPLMTFEAILDNSWYTDKIYPLLYQGYPVLGLNVNHRVPSVLGVPPTRAVNFRSPSDITIKDVSIVPVMNPAPANIVYNLPLEMARDYSNLATQAANLSLSTSANAWVTRLLTTPYPGFTRGTYNIRVRYVLPGIKKITSEKVIPVVYAY